MTDQTLTQETSNQRIALVVFLLVIAMVGMAYAAVPLYEIFCRVTGYGGTTRVAEETAPITVLDRDMAIRFNAATHRDMPWIFKPKEVTTSVKVGEKVMAYYEAYNPTDKVITGTATYNVTPHKAGPYFAKIDCFCFTEQTLQPGERVTMPVLYYIDPAMVDDSNLDSTHEITLSYTFFFKRDEDAADAAAVSR